MPRSDDPQRAGGKYRVTWLDSQGQIQRQTRATKGQAQRLMKHLRDKGLTPKMDRI